MSHAVIALILMHLDGMPEAWTEVTELAVRLAISEDHIKQHLCEMSAQGMVELRFEGETRIDAARIPHREPASVDCGECPRVSTGCRAGHCLKART